MLFALSAASLLLDGLEQLTSPQSSSSTSSNGQNATPFDPLAGIGGSTTSGTAAPGSGGTQISPQTMSALIDAQSKSGTSTTASLDPSQALQDLFSQIDANGDGQITKSEFENALGAGGTNTAMADDVFNKLDTNGDGTVNLDELKSALQGTDASSSTSGSNSDPLLQALDASSSSVTNSDGSTSTTITYADGSTVTMTTPAAPTNSSSSSSASNSAALSYNFIEKMIQQQAQALSLQAGSSLSIAA